MVRLSSKQRDVLINEINKLSSYNKFALNNPVELPVVEIKTWNDDIVWISRVLIGEIHIDEALIMITNTQKRKYYTKLMLDNQAPHRYKKIGFSADHGKTGDKGPKK